MNTASTSEPARSSRKPKRSSNGVKRKPKTTGTATIKGNTPRKSTERLQPPKKLHPSNSDGKKRRHDLLSGDDDGQHDSPHQDEFSSDNESLASEICTKKFYFTPTNDLDMLREILNIQPYAAKHGLITSRYQDVTDSVNEHWGAKLCMRTVKERFFRLVKEFKASDSEHRKKSGVAEDYTEHKQFLQDITDSMRDLETKKKEQQHDKQAKADRLVSAGERLRKHTANASIAVLLTPSVVQIVAGIFK